MHSSTKRLVLRPFTAEEARRAVDRTPNQDDRWASGYPIADELDPLRSFAARVRAGAESHPFTMYRIVETGSGLAVGGLGFFYSPNETGTSELGYGLVESARGKGYATEALRLALEIARSAGAARIVADTTVDNVASQKVMLKAGFAEYDRKDGTVYYAVTLFPES